MRKPFLGILGLLVLFLAALNVRLQARGRALEERLAAAEKTLVRIPKRSVDSDPSLPASEPVARPRTEAAPAVPSTPAAGGNDPVQVPAAAPAPAPERLQLAGKTVEFTLDNNNVATLVRVGSDDDLGLTPAQRKLVEDLRKNRELQTAAYSDLIQRIDAQTEEAIRQVLTPEQRAKYDAQHPSADVVTTFDPVEEKTSSGLRPGYLGISGGDVDGGGARVAQVLPNTPAAAFGLQKDDVILEVNGQAVPNVAGLTEKIREAGEGLPAVLRIRRAGQEFTQSVQLGALPK